MDCNLQKQVSPDVPAHESSSTYNERASDTDIDRNDSEFNPIGIASNEFHGLLRSAPLSQLFASELNSKEVISISYMGFTETLVILFAALINFRCAINLVADLLHCNLQNQVAAQVAAKETSTVDIESVVDANISRNQTKGCDTVGAKIGRLQKDLDMATRRNKEMNRGWNSTIEDGLQAATDLQKLVAGHFVPNLADADAHEIDRTILEKVKARAETLRSSLQVDDLRRVMHEPPYE